MVLWGAASGSLALGGCAHVARPAAPQIIGRDFSSAPVAGFRLRATTEAQVVAALGPPFQREAINTTVTNPKALIPLGTPIAMAVMKYLYIVANAGAATGGKPMGKNAVFVFIGGTLSAYDIGSSIPGDGDAPIDDSKIPLLKNGVTTREQVKALFGPPNGESAPVPYAQLPVGHLTYVRLRPQGGQLSHKILVVDFNNLDVMTHYTELEGTGPLPSLLPGQGAPPAPPVPGARPGAPPPFLNVPGAAPLTRT